MTATPASNTRLPTTLDQTNLARDGGGGTDGGGSGSGGRQSRLIHGRRKVSPLGSARYTSSRRRPAAFMASSHTESSDGFCLFRSQSTETRYSSPFGRLTIGQNDGKGLWEKWVVFWVIPMFLLCLGFLILVIRRFRILLFGKMTHHPTGSQWSPFSTPKWHAVLSVTLSYYAVLRGGETGHLNRETIVSTGTRWCARRECPGLDPSRNHSRTNDLSAVSRELQPLENDGAT
jgi:hypothetical protein